MTTVNEDDKMLLALREAVAEALERKRRLGQYAVLWRDGGPVLIGPDVPPELEHYRHLSSADSSGPIGSDSEVREVP